MTQKEKVEAYDKALEMAKKELQVCGSTDCDAAKQIFRLFPELKESENEKIRKEIINIFHSLADGKIPVPINFADIFTWLEKQGEPELSEDLGGYIAELSKQFPEVSFAKLSRIAVRIKNWLEKQAEKKHKFIIGDIISNGNVTYRVDNIVKNCIGQDCYFLVDIESEKRGTRYLIMRDSEGKTSHMGETTWLCEQVDTKFEKQGEQKSSNNVEPKFHEGDWIIRSAEGFKHNTYLVKEVKDYYVCEELKGRRVTFTFSDVHKNFKLWDISDAKDGDVLAYVTDEEDLWIMIYCCLYEPYEGHVCYHALLVNNNFSDKGVCYICINDLKPATKEQRDTLFAKMKKAGYTFDFEKKELKKIDNEEVNGEDYGIDGLWHAQRILEKTLGSVDGYQTDDGILSHKCAITAVKKLYEQKPVWGEEDEDYYDAIVAKLEVTQDDTALTDNQMEFLKSLKSRVQLKQEWSEEDKERLTSCIQLLKTSDGFDTINTKWLKSLKERYTWKPSDEQMNALDSTLQYSQVSYNSYEHLNSLYNDLKKLTE